MTKRVAIAFLAVLVLFLLTIAIWLYSPRHSVGLFFWFVAVPFVFVSYFRPWKRRFVSVLVISMIVALSFSPIDFAITMIESRKGFYYLPVVYGIGGGIEAGYYSPGCIVDRRGPKHAILLSI